MCESVTEVKQIMALERSVLKKTTQVTFFGEEEEVLVSGLSCGAHHTVVLTDDGRVFACGWNEYGQLGIPSTPADAAASAAAAAVEDAGERWLAIGTARQQREARSKPTELAGCFGGEKVVAVGCGREHSFAVTESGSVWAWGFGGVGQLGSGSASDASEPVRVAAPAGLRFRRIGALGLEPESAASVLRRQALYLQRELRHLEQLRLSLGVSGGLRTSASSLASSQSGGAVRKRAGTAPAKHKKCPACQKHLKKGLHFCNHCGHRIEGGSAPASPDPAAAPSRVVDEPPVMAVAAAAAAPAIVIQESAPVVVVPPSAAAPSNTALKAVAASAADAPHTPKPQKLPLSSPGARPGSASGAKLPKMSSLQQASKKEQENNQCV